MARREITEADVVSQFCNGCRYHNSDAFDSFSCLPHRGAPKNWTDLAYKAFNNENICPGSVALKPSAKTPEVQQAVTRQLFGNLLPCPSCDNSSDTGRPCKVLNEFRMAANAKKVERKELEDAPPKQRCDKYK
jgi:hypothetical protein